ncbi:MAG: hypothetical protein RID91_19205 [Azospirillaceae bacterium]
MSVPDPLPHSLPRDPEGRPRDAEGARRHPTFSTDERAAIAALSRRMGFPLRARRGPDGAMLCLTSREIGQPVYAVAKDGQGRYRVHAADGRVLVTSARFEDVTRFFGVDPRIDADDPALDAEQRFGVHERAVECRGEHSARTRP